MSATEHKWFLNALKRKNSLYCRIDVWGFVSVMLALLILFMVGIRDTSYGRRAVDLVAAVHSTRMPAALREDVMRISITRDGNIYFRDQQISLEDLPNKIQEGLRSGAEKKVYLAVDARAKYGEVPAVLDKIRFAGVEKVAFLTQ
jgi:biopolymer transport protein ExbD